MDFQERVDDATQQALESERCVKYGKAQAIAILCRNRAMHIIRAAHQEITSPIAAVLIRETPVDHHGDLGATVAVRWQFAASGYVLECHFPQRIAKAQT